MANDNAASAWFGAAAATRAALRALGTSTVSLKICAGGTDASTVEGLGLAAPAMEDIELSPVLVRNSPGAGHQVLVEAATLEEAVGEMGEAMRTLLVSSARMEVGGVEMKITDVSADYLGGAAYLYRISVEA